MPKKTQKAKTAKEYEELGKRLENIYLMGYNNQSEMIKMSFIKGLVTGFGGVIGATIVVGLLVWVLSLFDSVPFVDSIVDSLNSSPKP